LTVGGRDLEVIHTPGEAPDHICLWDRADRLLFCGDILLHGPVWTHLQGGRLADLVKSYRKLMNYFSEFDRLCNNEHKHRHTLSIFHIELAAHLLVQHLLRHYSSSRGVAEAPEAFSSRDLSRIASFTCDG
jgi:glyoxylase-like metal-dependent hydrolase (beta-lactamase superfamily II)